MDELADLAQEYCASEHFLLLDPALKDHAESLLAFWCGQLGARGTPESVEQALRQVAQLDLPLEARRSFPELLREFIDYLVDTGRFPRAAGWRGLVERAEPAYARAFRQDGSVRGETLRHQLPAVGRNDPCPCGSGKKYKKCCMELLG
jgi:hypothetical protein